MTCPLEKTEDPRWPGFYFCASFTPTSQPKLDQGGFWRTPTHLSVFSRRDSKRLHLHHTFSPTFYFKMKGPFFNFKIQLFTSEKFKGKITSLSFISSQEAPLFHPGISGPRDVLKSVMSFWILEGSISRKERTREMVQKVMTVEGFQPLFSLTPEHTSAQWQSILI